MIDKKLCMKTLDEFAAFKYDWDSYGAEPFNKKHLNKVKSFINDLKEDIPQPWVVPCLNGSIQLEWNINKKHLEIEITEENEIIWLKSFNKETKKDFKDEKYETGETDCRDMEEINKLIDWISGK